SPYDVALTASLPDGNFQASSVLDSNLNQPYMAKVGGDKEWCPSTASVFEFIQIDFSSPYRVCAIDTQGHHTLSWFVSTYRVAYSLNGSSWADVTVENKSILVGMQFEMYNFSIFAGNADGDTVVRNTLNDSSSFVTRFLRIYPLTYGTWPCLRVEVYGRELPSLDPRLPLNKTVTEGNSFTLHCLPLGNTDAVNVTWIRNNGSSTPFAVSVNITVNATRFDGGEYNCVVTNGVESVISPTAHVDVLYPPSLDSSFPYNHTVTEGNNLTLQCKVTAANPTPNITWYNVSTNKTLISYKDNLTFGLITRSHAGRYQCVVENGIGQAAVSRISTVDVQYPSLLDATYPRDHTITEGSTITLQCKVTAANPQPNITWYSVAINNTALSYAVNFTFVNISRNLAGKYYCLVDNGIDKAVTSRVNTVNVLNLGRSALFERHWIAPGSNGHSPSLETTYPRDNTVVEGNKLTLLCKVTASNPRPNITWHRVSANNTVLSYGANFTFSNISKHDAGKYYCAADNGIGKAVTSRISSIEVHYPPLLDSSYPRNRTIAEGSNLTLHCKVTAANPEPNITWYSFTSNHTALSHGVNLTFINTSKNHAGKYYCVVDNGIYGALTSSASTVDVQYTPLLNANHPYDNTVFEGENLTLQCKVTDANPQPNITWYRVPRSNTALSYGVNLTFVNVSRYDDGKYYCVVENGVGKIISRTSSVNVLYPPSLNFSYPRSHTVVEGSNLHLHCVVTAGKPRPNITWYNARANNSELSNNTSLSLFNISRDQAGEYYCVGTNGIGPAAISRMGVVDVQYSPSLIGSHPLHNTLVEGENLTLQCTVTAANPEPNITWYRAAANDTPLSYGFNLTFTNISRFHMGKYYCVVSNGVGNKAISRTATVNVLHPAILDMSYPRNHTVIEGSNLILQCVVTAANPLPNITWYNARARNTEISNSSSLNFINISRDRSGRYYCVARNGIGLAVISRMSTIDVQYPPIIDPAYPKDLNTTEEESVTLQCIIKESNPHANVTWIKLSDPGKVLSRSPVLNLTSIRHGDEGKYRCLVENGVGGQIKSRIAKLEVKPLSKGNIDVGVNSAQKMKRSGLIIILLGTTIAIFVLSILILLVFCGWIHKKTGVISAEVHSKNNQSRRMLDYDD
ncbi:unnamed protein product, partial [Porites lobata]